MHNCFLSLSIILCLSLSTSFAIGFNKGEVQKKYEEISRKNAEINTRLAKLGLTSEKMIKSWEDLDRLSAKPAAELSATDKKRIAETQRDLQGFAELTKKNGRQIDSLREEIRSDIKTLNELRPATIELAQQIAGQNQNAPPDLANNLDKLAENIQDNQIEATQISADLDKIEAKYDQQELAAYFADKLAQFMNSNSFCKAKNHCANPNTEDPVDPEILYREIFPDIKDALRRKGTEPYEKVHRGRKQEPANVAPAGGI